MSESARSRATIVVTNSLVSFAIMGASEPHRRILIRSDDRNLDLVGLDNRTFIGNAEIEAEQRSITLGGFLIPELRSFIVRTFPDDAQRVSNADGRGSHLSFAWRGLALERDLERIQKTFSMMAADLSAALEKDSNEAAEWQVAPLIALCHSKTNLYIRRGKVRRAAIVFTLVVYGLVALALGVNIPFWLARFKG
jgi:hypothetical protein